MRKVVVIGSMVVGALALVFTFNGMATELMNRRMTPELPTRENLHPWLRPGAPGGSLQYDNLRNRAFSGDAEAQFQFGAMYYRNPGVAVRWFKKAAGQGHAWAQYNLGLIYERGVGVALDNKQAAYWYRKAAEQGNSWGQASLGEMYYEGKGVPQDYAEAARWLKKAAEQGHDIVQHALGYLYEHGLGVPVDSKLAADWYRKAAEQGNADAQYALDSLAQSEYDNLRSKSESGDAEAQYQLGKTYYDGRGVARDVAEAARWFKKAAEQGHAGAQTNLGLMYETGVFGESYRILASGERVLLCSEYTEQAVYWYKKAAEQGNARAQDALDSLECR